MDHNNLGNGLDHEPAASSALVGNRSAEITVVTTEPAAALIASRAVIGLIEPPIEDVTVRHFCVMTGDGRRGIAEWAEFAWHAANRGSGTDGDVRQLRVRHAREMLDRVRADLRAADLIEIGMSPDQGGISRDSHLRLMLWLSYGCIGLGFFVLNWTLSSYLLGSGLLDYADHPWKTYAFSSLPITAAFTLKATAALFTETQRRRFAVALGLTGGVVATLAWSASFAWLFGPQPVAAMTLPGDGMTADQWIGKALVFTHILGETCCAAALGFWAEKLWLRNGRREARQTEESERGRADVRKVLDELEDIDAVKREELDYQKRFDAGLRAFTSKVAARYDAEVKRLEAQRALAVAKFLSAPPASS